MSWNMFVSFSLYHPTIFSQSLFLARLGSGLMIVPKTPRIRGPSNSSTEPRSYPKHLRWENLSIRRTKVQEEWYLYYHQCQVSPVFSLPLDSFISSSPRINKLTDRVAEVSEDTVKITIKNPKDKNSEPHAIEIPAGFVLWSTGIGMWLLFFPVKLWRD